MLNHFLTSNSRSILVQLALSKLESEENDDIIHACLQCNATGREMLHGILVTAAIIFSIIKQKTLTYQLLKTLREIY